LGLQSMAPSGRELPTQSGEGEGEQLGNYLAIVSNLKQGISVILSEVEGSLSSVAKSNKRTGWLYPLLDPFVTSFLGFAPPALCKASTRIRSLRMTRLGLPCGCPTRTVGTPVPTTGGLLWVGWAHSVGARLGLWLSLVEQGLQREYKAFRALPSSLAGSCPRQIVKQVQHQKTLQKVKASPSIF